MNRRRLTSLIVLTLISACNKTEHAAKSPTTIGAGDVDKSSIAVHVAAVEKGSYIEYGEYYGTVRGQQEAILISYGGGRVKAIHVKLGDSVTRGQKLCSIDGDRWENAFASAKLAEKIAKENYERSQLHLKRGSTSRLNTDRSQLDYLQAKNHRVEAEKNHSGAFCTSPFDGIVVAKHTDLFANVKAGQATFSIASLDKVKIVVGVPESAIEGYEVGNTTEVRLSHYPNRIWKGRVTSIAQSVNESDRTFEIEVLVNNTDHILKPGLTARTRILRYNLSDKIVIPTEVIITKAEGRIVMVAENGVARSRKVFVKTSNETQSLLDSGLSVGDQLIVKGQAIAVDGSPLKTME